VFHQGSYAGSGETSLTTFHEIDAGVDYRRSLSFTRRTTLDFSLGSTIVRPPVAEVQRQGLQYRVVGDASLTHEMGRTWRARLGYGRGVGFVEAFPEPVFSDHTNVDLSGFFNRRTELSVIATLTTGDVGLGSGSTRFESWNASARLRVGLNAMWALYTEYLYYYQDLGDARLVPTGVPAGLDRQSIRGGLTFWLPLLRR
jgi:hypothetical protein